MINLDRFSQGRDDPQSVTPVTSCEACGGEIYPGQDVYVVDGAILHDEHECLIRHIDPQRKTIEEALGFI